MSREPHKTYSREFKIEAVRLANQSDKPITQIARELGVRQNRFISGKNSWRRICQKLFLAKAAKSPTRPLD